MIHYKILILSFISIYFFMGLILGITGYPDQEIFPFFTWSLFTKVPNSVKQYTIRITEYNGKPIKPLFFQHAYGMVNKPNSSESDRILQNMGSSYKKDDQKFKQNQELLEKNYLNKTTKYEFILLTYSPIKKWQDGAQNIKVIQEYDRLQ